jgi:hypothetical protein
VKEAIGRLIHCEVGEEGMESIETEMERQLREDTLLELIRAISALAIEIKRANDLKVRELATKT